MASVNYKKLHSSAEVKNLLRHCDKEIRLNSGHRNKHIQEDKTKKNLQMKRNYEETCKRFDDRITYLDGLPKANKKADRVVCFALEIPAPAKLPADKVNEWTNKVVSEISKQYGSQNVINAYLHKDEVHSYMDSRTLQMETSRYHIHCFVVPGLDDKLNGKLFSSAANMKKLNNAIHEMTMKDYGVPFMDGSRRGSRKTVEKLKQESEQLEAEQHVNALREQERKIKELHEEAQRNALRASESLSEARKEADGIITEARRKASQTISEAEQRAEQIITGAKEQARAEIEREKKVKMASFSNYVRKAVEEKQRRDRVVTEIDNSLQTDKSDDFTRRK